MSKAKGYTCVVYFKQVLDCESVEIDVRAKDADRARSKAERRVKLALELAGIEYTDLGADITAEE